MISTQFSCLSFAAFVITAICGNQCFAAVVAYSNIDPNYVGARGGYLMGNSGVAETKLAQRFTPTSSGKLSKLEMTLAFTPTQNIDKLTLSILTDGNGRPGRVQLWSQVFYDQTDRAVTGSQPPSSYEVANGLSLLKGTNYWLVATTTPDGLYPYTWWQEGRENIGTTARYHIRGPADVVTGEWIINLQVVSPEFGLRVSVIPEPGTAAVMLTASATLLAVRRRC